MKGKREGGGGGLFVDPVCVPMELLSTNFHLPQLV